MKDQNLGRCNAVDRDEMGRDQNDNGVSENTTKVQNFKERAFVGRCDRF